MKAWLRGLTPGRSSVPLAKLALALAVEAGKRLNERLQELDAALARCAKRIAEAGLRPRTDAEFLARHDELHAAAAALQAKAPRSATRNALEERFCREHPGLDPERDEDVFWSWVDALGDEAVSLVPWSSAEDDPRQTAEELLRYAWICCEGCAQESGLEGPCASAYLLACEALGLRRRSRRGAPCAGALKSRPRGPLGTDSSRSCLSRQRT